MERRVILVAARSLERKPRRLAPGARAGARGVFGIGENEDPLLERGDRAFDGGEEPGHARLLDGARGAAPAALDAAGQAREHRLGGETHRGVVHPEALLDLFPVDFALAGGTDAAAQAAEATARPARRRGLEQRLPQAERLRQAAGRHAQIVDRFGIAPFAHAPGGPGEGMSPGGEIGAQAGGVGGARVHGHRPWIESSIGWGCRASSLRTRSDRSLAVSSTGRVASSVSKPYSRDS